MGNKIFKRYVLENIERFCDTDSLEQVEVIVFGELEYGSDFRIDYLNGNSDGYSYEKNVIPLMKEINIKTNKNNNTVVIGGVEYPPTAYNLTVIKRYNLENDVKILKDLSDIVLDL